MKWLASLPVLLLFASSVQGQLRLDGGTSTLFHGSGGQATMYLPNSTISGGLGYHDGHLLIGASDSFLFDGFKTTVGDQTLGFSFDGVGLGLALKGISASRVWKDECHAKPARRLGAVGYLGNCGNKVVSAVAFVGATGVGFFAPFATATRTQHIGSGALLQFQIRNLTLSSLDVVEGGKYSLAQGASYSDRHLRLSGSGGLLNSQKFFQGSATLQPIRPWSLYANHQSYFVPYAAQSNGVGTNLTAGRFTALAGLNESKSLGRTITGENVGAGVRVGFIREESTWYKATGQTLLVHTITETMRHWTLTEAIAQATGKNSYSFGGGYSGNRISVSVSHSVQFLLNGRGYQQTTGVQISFRIRDTVINAQTVTDPFGKTQYGAYAESYVQTGLQVAGHETHGRTGKFAIQGKCVLPDGSPVEGCAVVIDQEITYSNSRGEFSTHAKKKGVVPVSVPIAEFAAPGDWQVIEAPNCAAPDAPVRVVVQRL